MPHNRPFPITSLSVRTTLDLKTTLPPSPHPWFTAVTTSGMFAIDPCTPSLPSNGRDGRWDAGEERAGTCFEDASWRRCDVRGGEEEAVADGAEESGMENNENNFRE